MLTKNHVKSFSQRDKKQNHLKVLKVQK